MTDRTERQGWRRAWRVARESAATELRRRPFWVGTALGAVAVLLALVVVPLVSRERDAEVDRPLVILSGQDDSIGAQRQRLVAEWNATHAIKARIVELSPIADAQHSEMLARAQSEHSDVDVYNLDVTWTAEFADAGYIRRLDEAQVPTQDFLAGPLSTCRYDGGLWALPFNGDVGLLYYRSDLLTQIGKKPPEDWDTVARQVDDVRARSGDDVTGYVSQLADYEGLTVTALEMTWGERGTIVDDDGRVLPDEGDDVGALEAGLTRLKQLSTRSESDLPAFDEAGTTEEFRNGKALFMRNWPLADRKLKQPGDVAAPPFGVKELPGGSGALGGQNLAVSSRTTRPEAARALVEFLTGDRSQQVLFERGGLPATRRVVYEDPVFRDDPVAKTLKNVLDTARRRPSVPHYTEFSAAFRSAVDGYLRRGETLPEDTLRARLDDALDGRLPSPEPAR